MTKKKKKRAEDRQRVKEQCLALSSLLNLEDFTFTWHWPDENKEEKSDDGAVWRTNASIDTDLRYKRVALTFYPCFFDQDPEEQAAIILHEMAHTVTERQYQLLDVVLRDEIVTRREAVDAREATTQAVAMIMLRLMRSDTSYFRKKLGLKKY